MHTLHPTQLKTHNNTRTNTQTTHHDHNLHPTPQELTLWREFGEKIERSDSVYLLCITPDALRVSLRNAPPIRRRVLGAVSIDDGDFLGSVALDDPEEDPVEIRRGVVEIFEARTEIPSVVHVGDPHLHALLSPLARAFNFILHCWEMPPEIAIDLSTYIESVISRITDGGAGDGEFGVVMNGQEPKGIPNRPPSAALGDVIRCLEQFCSDHFSPSLYQEALDLAAWLDYAADPSPLLRGRPEIWACGIAWFIASEHSLWYRENGSSLTTGELCHRFGVRKRTAEKRRGDIRSIIQQSAL